MNPARISRLQLVLVTAMFAAVLCCVWAFGPVRVESTVVSIPREDSQNAQVEPDEQVSPIRAEDVPEMILWTKPPPVIEPPAAPPPLRLNAELLAIAVDEQQSQRIATLYLAESGQVLRLMAGDTYEGMVVEEVTDDQILFRKGNQTLAISRRR